MWFYKINEILLLHPLEIAPLWLVQSFSRSRYDGVHEQLRSFPLKESFIKQWDTGQRGPIALPGPRCCSRLFLYPVHTTTEQTSVYFQLHHLAWPPIILTTKDASRPYCSLCSLGIFRDCRNCSWGVFYSYSYLVLRIEPSVLHILGKCFPFKPIFNTFLKPCFLGLEWWLSG